MGLKNRFWRPWDNFKELLYILLPAAGMLLLPAIAIFSIVFAARFAWELAGWLLG